MIRRDRRAELVGVEHRGARRLRKFRKLFVRPDCTRARNDDWSLRLIPKLEKAVYSSWIGRSVVRWWNRHSAISYPGHVRWSKEDIDGEVDQHGAFDARICCTEAVCYYTWDLFDIRNAVAEFSDWFRNYYLIMEALERICLCILERWARCNTEYWRTIGESCGEPWKAITETLKCE